MSLNRGTDTLLRKTSLTLDKGGATLWSQGYGYGDASRLASVTMGDDTVQYGYVTNSPLVGSMAFGHSGSTVMTTTKQYDAVNRLTQTSSAVGGTVVSSHQNSEINTLNQRKRTNLADGTYWKYNYNGQGELIQGTLYNASNQVVNGMDFQYTYDSSGNRLTHTVTGGATTVTTYTSNLVNQYTNIAAGVTATPSYDADGNMTSSGSAYDDRILEYDGENRLTTIRRSGDQAVVATYTYDDQSRRVRVQTTSAAPQGVGDIVNVWDGWNLVGELDYTYAWGLDLSGSEQGAGGIGGLVIQRDATSGDAYFPAYDPNGNLTTLVKSSDGTVGARYSYDPYGNLLSISSDPYSGTNRFRFSTKYFCPEVGLYYYGYRFYNPETGRWVNRDPIGEVGGVNLYGMVGNDVVGRFDVLGLKWKKIGPNKDKSRMIYLRQSPDDTFERLAEIVGLDFKEYRKWAVPVAEPVSDKSSGAGCRYSVPNIWISTNFLNGPTLWEKIVNLGAIIGRPVSDLGPKLSGKKIISTHNAAGLPALLDRYKVDMWGIVVYGHGGRNGYLGDYQGTDFTTQQEVVGALGGEHKLAIARLMQCFGLYKGWDGRDYQDFSQIWKEVAIDFTGYRHENILGLDMPHSKDPVAPGSSN